MLHDAATAVGINLCVDLGVQRLWQPVNKMHDAVLETVRVEYGEILAGNSQPTRVTDLATAFRIKWRCVEHDFVSSVLASADRPYRSDVKSLGGGRIISQEARVLPFADLRPFVTATLVDFER